MFDGVCNFCNGSINLLIRLDKKDRFRKLYATGEETSAPVVQMKARRPFQRVWGYAAAAIVVAVAFVVLFKPGVSKNPKELADTYISSQLSLLSPSMSVQDSIDTGKDLYNKGDYAGAVAIFEDIASRFMRVRA